MHARRRAIKLASRVHLGVYRLTGGRVLGRVANMRHGLDRGDPVATIAALRAGLAGARPSPETAAQVALVRSWRRGR